MIRLVAIDPGSGKAFYEVAGGLGFTVEAPRFAPIEVDLVLVRAARTTPGFFSEDLSFNGHAEVITHVRNATLSTRIRGFH